MANNDIPPVPVPPADSAVPPVEPAPQTPPTAPPAPPAAPTPPPVPPTPVGLDERPNPYAAPAAPVAPPAPGYTAYPAGGYAAAPPQGLAIASMITGIAGVVLTFASIGFLPALAAVILGHIAQRRQPHAKPFWLTGIITGYVGVGLGILIGIFWIVVFGLAASGANFS